MIFTAVLGSLLFLSALLNFFLFLKIKKIKRPNRTMSVELQEFLADVNSSVGMLAVTRVDPNQILIRSPRQQR